MLAQPRPALCIIFRRKTLPDFVVIEANDMTSVVRIPFFKNAEVGNLGIRGAR
jgi:hypothetical protein